VSACWTLFLSAVRQPCHHAAHLQASSP
jgi:hypothetical protein